MTGTSHLTVAVDSTPADGSVVLTLAGELDYGSAAVLSRAVTGQLDLGKHRIVLDMAQVKFCDSSGLAALLSAQRRAVAGGGWLRLARPHLQLRRVLSITNLDQHLQIYRGID